MESPGWCRPERDAAHDEPLTRIGAAAHNGASHVSSAASFRHAGFRAARYRDDDGGVQSLFGAVVLARPSYSSPPSLKL